MTAGSDREMASFALWREDDNGQRFLVATYPDRTSAEARLRLFLRAPHKQTYWIEASPGAIPAINPSKN